MKERKAEVYVKDILEAIERIEEYIQGMDIEEFREDRRTVDAVVRNLEIIGEASKMIPRRVKDGNPEIPWSEMAKIRDKLIHGYFEIQYSIIWTTVMEDLPPLKEKMEAIMNGSL